VAESENNLEQQLVSVDIFAAFIHDVKNTLGLLMSKADGAHDREGMHLLTEADDKLNYLLLMYKMQRDMVSVNPDAIEVESFLKILAASYQPVTRNQMQVEMDDPTIVSFFDKALIELCIGNAIHNADRFAHGRVRLSCRMEGEMTVISVHDNGDGYPEDVIQNFSLGTVTSRDSSGLGLYLASRIAALHVNKGVHGFVRVFNEDGAVFEMVLP
jgi:K+-sensing histidine kinase KdpD